MSDHSRPLDTTLPAATSRPLLAALTRWWPGSSAAHAADPVLGYESAQPWTLEEAADDDRQPPY